MDNTYTDKTIVKYYADTYNISLVQMAFDLWCFDTNNFSRSAKLILEKESNKQSFWKFAESVGVTPLEIGIFIEESK